jgi:hypothetical protein
MKNALLWIPLLGTTALFGAAAPLSVSGIYPHLAMFNQEGECGTGAVVPWADRLWVITYGPHKPMGSSDKLYEITPELSQIIRPESIGGTPANRMIHRESNQLAIGPYLIDALRNVRVIPWQKMPGRLTGTARHLSDPAHKLYYATMEEGLYEVDVHSLAVKSLIQDGNKFPPGKTDAFSSAPSKLPGYHGKGLYSGQGRVVYSNNGEQGAPQDPTIPSGALAQWQGEADWTLVRRNQFTEVTGPGGIYGATHPDTDPIWSVGWDSRSLLLMLLENEQWHCYRLPKASHSYDGAHGWNTEWPRIRDIGEKDLLMTMHGTFWKFPKDFGLRNSAGITPRSTYLKVIGDFARWNDRVVFGCDDTAKSEFLNKRQAKGALAGPGQSQSNLWFLNPEQIDQLGPVHGRGSVWWQEDIDSGAVSDPFLFSGYTQRGLFLSHASPSAVSFSLEIDETGRNEWRSLRSIQVPPGGSSWTEFAPEEKGVWVRIRPDSAVQKASATFAYRNADNRPLEPAAMFAGLAKPGSTAIDGGLLYAMGNQSGVLRLLARNNRGEVGCYELDKELTLKPVDDPKAGGEISGKAAIPEGVLGVDAASVLVVDSKGRWRLPKGEAALDQPGVLGAERVCREVCTERDLFNAHGSFYELPAENALGFAKIRPICTHQSRIQDYASFRGLLVLTGLKSSAPRGGHVVRSDDGKASVWVGAVDDLWKLGKPRGQGGPWKNTAVRAGTPSDPYLMNGYDHKRMQLSHNASRPVNFRVEVDPTGDGQWILYREFRVEAGIPTEHRFADAFSAAWVRVQTDQDTTATAHLLYE